MSEFFTEAMRRDPFPVYAELRARSRLFRDPRSGLTLLLDYEG